MNEKSTSREDFLATARERFRIAQDAEFKTRTASLDDLRFVSGEQWPEDIKRQRDADKRPCLTLDRLGQFVRQVTNDLRQNRPAITVNPVDSNGDPDTAEIIQGLIRHIEHQSSADVAYDTAAEYAAIMGFGFFRLRTEYCDPMSFDQEILIEPVANPFSVYLDPAAVKPDRSDMQYCFLVTRLREDEFKRLYPDADSGTGSGWEGLGDQKSLWLNEEGVMIAEYLSIEQERVEIALLPDGSVMPLEEVPEGYPVVKTRQADVPRVRWAQITGTEVLEEKTLPGRYIPVIPVFGRELLIDGERQLSGVVRTAKDAQRQYNFFASAETEAIALAPRAPFIMAEGQDEGYEGMWQQANNRNFARLVYKPRTVGGELAPPPQRQVFEPAIQSISMARMQAAADMNAATGIYDAALGARSNETSGRAIIARQREGDNANFHFADNVTRALKHAGRILIEWIPVYYDADRVVRIIGEEGDQKTVRINAPHEDRGITKLYDLTTGKYDVTVTTGPSYTTKRQEAVESMMQLTQAYPQIMQIAGDLMVQNMDWPGAKPLAERLKKALPPGMAEDEKKMPVPPQVQAQLQQMNQMIEQLSQALNEASDDLRTKRLELESRERIAALQTQAQLIQKQADLSSKEGIELLRAEIGAISERLMLLNVDQPVDDGSSEQQMPEAA
jgi:hypothetical protein